LRRSAGFALVALCAAVAPAAAGAAPLRVSAKPGLYPAFRTSVPDYVVRCAAGKPVRMKLAAARGFSVAVGEGRARKGSFGASPLLAAGQRVTLTLRHGERAHRYSIRCLPPDFPAWTTERLSTPRARWYLLSPTIGIGVPGAHYAAFFDRHGVPVWWMNGADPPDAIPSDVRLLPNDDVVWARRIGTFGYAQDGRQRYEEHRLDGKLVQGLRTKGSPTDDHDIAYLPNGNHMLVTYRPRRGVDLRPYGGPADATIVDGVLQELGPSGKLVWSWSTGDHLPLAETASRWWGAILSRTGLPPGAPYDPVHVNSFSVHGGRVLVSMRHTDAIYDIDRKSGRVMWKLGGTHRPESLAFAGDSFAGFGGQHDARALGDGTVTLHDNGSALGRGPRGVRYRIDEKARTATLLDQVMDPKVTSSFFLGSARRLPGGHWVMSWGGNSIVEEMTGAGRRVFALHLGGGLFSYRAVPVLAGQVSAAQLRSGMDAMVRADR
jgi:hypothetical protein